MRISFHLALIAAASSSALVVGGCALHNPGRRTAPPVSAVAGPLATPQERATYHVMLGTMAAHRGQPRLAVEQLLDANRLVPSKKLVEEATALALTLDDPAPALAAVRELVKQEPTDPRALGTLLDLAVRSDQANTAFDAGRAFLEHAPRGVDAGYRDIADILGQPENLNHGKVASEVMTRLVALHPQRPGAYYAAGLLALRQYDSDAAAHDAQRAIELAPDDGNAIMLLAAAQIQNGQLADAERTAQPLLAQANGRDDIALRFGYAQILFKYGRYDEARTALQALLQRDPENTSALLLLTRANLLLNRTSDAAAALARIPPGNPGRDSEVQFYQGRIAELERNYPLALVHYSDAAGTNFALPAGIRRAVVLSDMGELTRARNELAALAQAFPDHATDCVTADSQLLADAGHLKDALAVINTALATAPDDEDLLYQRALIDDRSGRSTAAQATLRKLLAMHPHDARYLNGLGFMLTEHGPPQGLDEAHQLISKALRLAPEDPAILDSMGWVLFRQGQTEQALPYLQRAYDLFNDPEVAAHLITVLAAAGKHDAARQTLNKALARDPGNATLEDAAKHLTP